MAEKKKQHDNESRGMLVEDESVVAGRDRETGETRIRPKTADGTADESVEPTDERETAEGESG